jgi:succinate dehydrogenase / fumarate reductase, cytochrome b subunit
VSENNAISSKPGKPQSFMEKHHFLLRRLHSLTGIVPTGVFLISHLLTNSSILWGAFDSRHDEYGHRGVASFQHEVNFIHSIPFLLVIELSLWGAIAFHSILGVYYAMTGNSNTARYGFAANWRYRLQRITGYIGIFFILYHVGTLRWGWTFLTPGGTAWSAQFAASTTAAILRGGYDEFTAGGLAVTAGYLIGVTALVFHFANGLWTAAITWGLTISRNAQQRWGYACAGLGAALMAMAWGAVLGFATLNPNRAKQVELKFNAGHSAEVESPAVAEGVAGVSLPAGTVKPVENPGKND